MTYLAPRQGLFAIILLVSFCLQTLLLVISTDQQLGKSRALKGEQMVAQLIDEARLSLENKDRVSLSVIANRYTSEQDVTRILIRDNNDDILVPVGNAPMQQGETIRQIATQGDAVVGSVALTLKDISKGEIIAMQWPFVVGTMVLHILLWLIYGYLARPTKEQINAISRDVQELHREQYQQLSQRGRGRDLGQDVAASDTVDHSSKSLATADNGQASNTNNVQSPEQAQGSEATVDDKTGQEKVAVRNMNIKGELSQYIKGQQNPGSASQSPDVDIDADHSAPATSTQTEQSNSTTSELNSTDSKASIFNHSKNQLSATRSFDSVRVQVVLYDDYNMLDLLVPNQLKPYLALCTQLLNQAITELLKQPLLLGVSLMNEPVFDEKGASVLLKADNSHAKVALAGVMLGKLYLMLNKIIYDKHTELSRVAFPAQTGVSDDAQSGAMTHLLESVGKKEQMLILLPHAGLKQISNHVQVQNIMRPTTVYERECAIFDGCNDSMIQRLVDVRNAVLMIDSLEKP